MEDGANGRVRAAAEPAGADSSARRTPSRLSPLSAGARVRVSSAVLIHTLEQCLNRMQTVGLIHTLEQCLNRMQTVGLIHTLEQCLNRMQTVGLIHTLEQCLNRM
ncbi:hypothetical protein AAFF_G00158880 [Aldrovandia affinis]|uniref:Uncharacterized protein n=1 Tax=Aldrovandia affinis TaxID=143900 RepID=A0AAD7RNE4_9TELE|nr:hypothetical protein AAFF_G00158880 [Aldrovandia affinis]